LVGKGPDSEPPIELDTMLKLTAGAESNGEKFDGVDLFLYDPHVNIDSSDDEIKALAEKVTSYGLNVGTVVAPVYGDIGGGRAMGDASERQQFLGQVQKACGIAKRLRELGVRPYGVVRFDSACSVEDWAADPETNQQRIAETFREAAKIARDHGERLAAEGEICWGGMHSWRKMVDLLERVNEPETLGFQADLAHTLLYLLGYNAEEADRLVPADYNWDDPKAFEAGYKKMTDALRPWTIDFHVAQNDATVKGAGSHDKTGRHVLPKDPNAKLDIPWAAGHWLRDENNQPLTRFRHICWDGCMFNNDVLLKQETWNEILEAMVSVRAAHGWQE
jgi:sugar phosphate isomerase/epimerase